MDMASPPNLSEFAAQHGLTGLSAATLEAIQAKRAHYSVARGRQFLRFLRRIERDLLQHRAITANRYTAWFKRGEQNEAQLRAFIIRGVSLVGVASAGTARDIREAVWQHLASDWKPRHLERICTREVGLAQLPEVFATMLSGGSFGRTLVAL